jgi:hypothetical protein
MRWFIVFLILVLAAWHFMPDPEPVPVDESFIAEPVKQLENAEGYEDQYLDQADARKKRMEEALEEGGG